jgi:hypothetical protein
VELAFNITIVLIVVLGAVAVLGLLMERSGGDRT